MSLLAGFRVVQLGGGLAAAAAGRLFADLGAEVRCIDADRSTLLGEYLNGGKAEGERCRAGRGRSDRGAREVPSELRAAAAIPRRCAGSNATAAIVTISPFGQTGPRADDPASDLTLFYASGIARLLTGQVDDLAEAPIRPVGEQSAFIGGLAAACAGMHAATGGRSGAIDRRVDRGSAGDDGDDRARQCRARRQEPVAQAA